MKSSITSNEDNMCDLDPTKVCDNCCKCIEKGNAGDYNEVLADFPAKDEGYIMDNINLIGKEDSDSQSDDADEDDSESMDADAADAAGNGDDDDDDIRPDIDVDPIDIDPRLKAEWEAKLSAEGLGEDVNDEPHVFRGVRPRQAHVSHVTPKKPE